MKSLALLLALVKILDRWQESIFGMPLILAKILANVEGISLVYY